MKLWLTAQEIAAEALPDMPTTKRRVNAYAERHGWRDHVAKARRRAGAEGGGGFEYHVDLLPAWARLAYLRRHVGVAEPVTIAAAEAEPAAGDLTSAAVTSRDARLTIVEMANRHHGGSGLSVIAADQIFADLYNRGVMPVPGWVREAVGALSPRSIARWRAATKRGATSALAVDRAASRKGTGVLDRAGDGHVRSMALAALAKNPQFTAKHIRALVRDRFGDTLPLTEGDTVALPPLRTFQHALKAWRHAYRHELTLLTDPDGFKNSVRFVATGTTKAERLNEVWQIDASPADVMTHDGRQTIYVAVDVFSRRVAVLVSQTARADAVGLLVRKCLVAWGVPDAIKSDNGSDFTARQTTRLLSALGIEHRLAAPFSPEQKGIVERAIGTFQRDFARTLPGFVGHSVADRKKIEAKTAFSRRLGANEETLFNVDLTAAELQEQADAWAETIYAHAPHAGLKGRTPFQAAASFAGPVRKVEDPASLDVLLARVPGKDGIRRVTRSGIRIDGTHYLIGNVMPGEDVLCRMDPADLGRLFVFNAEGDVFLGHAVAPELSGLDPAKTIARVRDEQKNYMAGRVADIRREARRIGPRDVANAIRRQSAQATGALVAFPKRADTHETSAITAARDAIAPIEPTPLSGRAAELHQALKEEAAAAPPAPENVTPLREGGTQQQRYRRALALIERLDRGETIDQADALWLGGYREGAEYRAMKGLHEDFGERALR